MNHGHINMYYYVGYAEIIKDSRNQTFDIQSYYKPQIMQIVNGYQLPINKIELVTKLETHEAYFLGIL